MTITLEQIKNVAKQVGDRDFHGFAAKVAELDEIAGALAEMHAGAADGNSPDVCEWVRGTFDDALDCDAETVDDAREWWINRYGN